MTRMVNCLKLGVEAEGLDSPPFPGPKGQRIYDAISKEAWQEWLGMQTVLINEYRLASFEPKAKKFLEEEREKFLYGGGIDLPDEFVSPKE